jgi:uncharacterized protein
MLVGVISDIHGHLSEAAEAALALCDIILCAGDVERPTVLMELEAIAPTVAVLGNCDTSLRGMNIPFTASPRIGGVRFFMTHRPEDIGTPAEDVQVVVHGHTHIPRNEEVAGKLYLNPGSASKPRGGSQKSIARLTIAEGKIINTEFVTLE